MKNHLLHSVSAVALLVAMPLSAYTFTFKNFTTQELVAKLKLVGVAEEFKELVIPAMKADQPGEASKEYTGGRAALCLHTDNILIGERGKESKQTLYFIQPGSVKQRNGRGADNQLTLEWLMQNPKEYRRFEDSPRDYFYGDYEGLLCYNRTFAIFPRAFGGFRVITTF